MSVTAEELKHLTRLTSELYEMGYFDLSKGESLGRTPADCLEDLMAVVAQSKEPTQADRQAAEMAEHVDDEILQAFLKDQGKRVPWVFRPTLGGDEVMKVHLFSHNLQPCKELTLETLRAADSGYLPIVIEERDERVEFKYQGGTEVFGYYVTCGDRLEGALRFPRSYTFRLYGDRLGIQLDLEMARLALQVPGRLIR